MGLVRRHFRWLRENRSPISTLESIVSALLAYWLAPATVFLFWVRYLVRQDFRGTTLHILSISLLVVAATCLPILVSRALRPGDLHRPPSRNALRAAFMPLRAALLMGSALLLLSFGVIRGLPSDSAQQPSASDFRSWTARTFQLVSYRPYAELSEPSFSPLPARENWTDESVAAVPGARLNQVNLRYARGYHLFLANARLWRANFEGAYLSEADLRGANMREAVLRTAVLDKAQAGHAILVSADGRDANLSFANLRAADLSYGVFAGATLSNAKLTGASLYAADFRDARLLRADLSKTDFRDAKLERAMLSLANLQEADFSSAKLGGANLAGAQLKGAILLDSDLKKADLRGAFLTGAIVRGAEFEGAYLDGADLRGAVGLTAAQVCAGSGWHGALLDSDVLSAAQARCGAALVGPARP
jgi:uncharacterized protein YjbI with pentapeptide repeats